MVGRRVETILTANASGFVAGTGQASNAARQMASSVETSGKRASRSLDDMSSAAKRLAIAERHAADAAGQVRVAESRLDQVRKSGNATAAQAIKAEENLAKSTRRLAAAQKEVNAASVGMRGKSAMAGLIGSASELDRIGGSLLKIGGVAALSLVAAGKAAMDWQTAWTGVTKTVNGSADEMDRLENQLRGMARSMPQTPAEIAKVAEAAGQLGVKTKDIASFTRVMIELGDTTNLTSDEAATSLAQFMNVMGTAGRDVGRLGATIVDLGNKGASTERDIVQLGQRIAGAGKQVGLSEQQVLGYASAIASTGTEAEAGGTAISMAFVKIDKAVRKGGAGLEALAKTSGMSADQFKQAWANDAGQATATFVAGLGKVNAAGGDTNAILAKLGITGARQSDTIKRLAASGSLLTDQLNISSGAWKSNSALVNEAAQRYATAQSQAKIAWNQIKDSTIDAGTAMLPIFAHVATALGKIATFFADLPAPVRIAGVALVGTVAIMGLVGGSAIKGVTGLLALRTAYQTAGLAATGFGRAAKIAQLSIPGVGIALFAVTTALQMWASKTTVATEDAGTFAQAMTTVEGALTRTNVAMNENVRQATIQSLQQKGAFDLAKQLGLSLGTVADAAMGETDAITEVNQVLARNAALLPQSGKANADLKNTAVALYKAMQGTALGSIAAAKAEEDRRAATESGIPSMTNAAGRLKLLNISTNDLATANTKLAQQQQKVINNFTIMKNGALGVEQANQGWQASTDAVSASVKANGKSLSITTEKGRANRSTVIGMMTALNDKIKADFQATVKTKGFKVATEEASIALRKGREKILASATAAHLNTDKVKAMIKQQLLTPKELLTKITNKGMRDMLAQISDLKTRIQKLESRSVSVSVGMDVHQTTLAKSIIKKYGKFAKLPGIAAGGPIKNWSGMGRQKYDTELAALRVDEHVWTPEEVDAVGGHDAMIRARSAARRGLLHFDQGGAVNRGGLNTGSTLNSGSQVAKSIKVNASTKKSGLAPEVLPALAAGYLAAVTALYSNALTAGVITAAGQTGSGPVAGGGYAKALAYARRHVGHRYIFGTLWDCSGFISALHSIILGQAPHRRYSTPAFHGAHAAGFTRGKRSPFMVGVNPSPGRFGHMAGKLNGVNVESAGGVGVRVGSRARGPGASMFSWRGGLARGGPVTRGEGDLPYDLLDPRGEFYNPYLARAMGYGRGGLVRRPSLISAGEHGPERVLSPVQTRSFENLVRVLDQRDNGGYAEIHYHFPNYIGSQNDLVRTLSNLNRANRLEVIKR